MLSIITNSRKPMHDLVTHAYEKWLRYCVFEVCLPARTVCKYDRKVARNLATSHSLGR